MAKGKFIRPKASLIVFEGSDGSGKTTQAKLLHKYLVSKKIPVAYISFPRYTDSIWGAIVRRYLDGDFGKLDPYLASMLYAGDRASAGKLIAGWLASGKIVVCDRYVASSVAHQGAKIKSDVARRKFAGWLEDLEYRENAIPVEDVVILLDVPRKFAVGLMAKRKLDIHEADRNHLKNAIAIYESFAATKKNWVKIIPVVGDKLQTIAEVHEKVIEILKKKKIL